MRVTNAVKHCPACDAPAVSGRAECWSCGADLNPPTPTVPASGPPAPDPAAYRQCPQCTHCAPVFHPACQACGFVFPTAPRSLDLQPADRSWTETVLGSGFICMRPSPSRLIANAVGALAICAYGTWELHREVARYRALHRLNLELGHVGGRLNGPGLETGRHFFRAMESVDWFFFFVIVPLLLAALAYLVWTCCHRVDWIAGPNSLRVRYRLFGRQWQYDFTDAELQLGPRRSWGWHGGSSHMYLIVQSAQRRHCLMAPGWSGLAGSIALGRRLSEITGWEFASAVNPVAWAWLTRM